MPDERTSLVVPSSLSSIVVLLLVAFVAAASPLFSVSLRDAGMVLIGFVSSVAILAVSQRSSILRESRTNSQHNKSPINERHHYRDSDGDKDNNDKTNSSNNKKNDNDDCLHAIRTLQELRRVLPSRPRGGEDFGDAKKVIGHLDDQMIGFVERSPLLYLATVDASGRPFVSPKGDRPGFVQAVGQKLRGGKRQQQPRGRYF